MQLQTISDVSKQFGVSTRTLRYYEQVGLLQSRRREGYAYRVYGEDALERLRQILLLRKLRFSLSQIGDVLQNRDARAAVEAFEQNLSQIDEEMEALATLRSVLAAFVARLQTAMPAPHLPKLLADDDLLALVGELPAATPQLKEKISMQQVSDADRTLSRLTDVRIVRLPPFYVASAHVMGENPESRGEQIMDDFIAKVNLPKQKPDFRKMGFNNPVAEGPQNLGYEFWVSIPEDMKVPAPLVKKRFLGGLYAAHMIPMGAFQEWALLAEWIEKNEEYEADIMTPRTEPYTTEPFADPCMEEVLNPQGHLRGKEIESIQLDLLLPIRKKK